MKRMVDYRESARKLGDILDGAVERHRHEQEAEARRAQLKRKGHRLGLFLTLFGLAGSVLAIMAAMPNSGQNIVLEVFGFIAFFLLLFGYLMSRLWFWFRAA